MEETILSARSLRTHMPDIPVVLHTDLPDQAPKDLFQDVRLIPQPTHSFQDKIAPLLDSPFRKTIFLDTDTFIASSFSDVFDLLDRFDIAAAHAPMRTDAPFATPNVFAELNTGVIAYRMNAEVKACFRLWETLYKEQLARQGRVGHDQPGFRQALWESDIRFYVLPSEYNLRTVMPGCAGKQRVRIIHGRAKNLQKLADAVNGTRDIRVFLPDWRWADIDHLRVLSLTGNFWHRLIRLPLLCASHAEKHLGRAKSRMLDTLRRFRGSRG